MSGFLASRRTRIFLALCLGLAGLGWWVQPWVRTVRFLALATQRQDLLGRWAARGAAPLAAPVALSIPTRQGLLPALVHAPLAGSDRTLVLIPGVHSAGIQEPRLTAFARTFAAAGYRVVTVAAPDLMRFRLTGEATDAIEDATAWVTSRPELCPKGKVGLVGISFAGGLSVVASGRPALSDRLDFVLSIGGHADLSTVLRYLSTGDVPAVATLPPALLAGQKLKTLPIPKPHDYGAAVCMLNLASRVVPPDQVRTLETGITGFLEASALDSTDHAAALPRFEAARDFGEAAPEPSRTLLRHVNTRNMAALGEALRPFLPQVPQDPARSPLLAPAPHARVFLLHGLQDPVVPAAEALLLGADLSHKVPTRVLVSGLIGHTGAQDTGGVKGLFRLLSFWKDVLSR